MRPIDQELLTFGRLVEVRVRVQMVSLDIDRESAFADEVHERLIPDIIRKLIVGFRLLVFFLRVRRSVVLLLQVDHVRAREDALELDDELSDALNSLFLLVEANASWREVSRQDPLPLLQMRLFYRVQHRVHVYEALEGLFGDFALVNRRDLAHESGQLRLQLLRRVRLVDVLEDLRLETGREIQVQHRGICLI